MLLVGAPLILAAALAQASAPEAKLLDVVPAEADVVVRVSNIEKGKSDLVAMLKAMSPALAKTAEPAIQGVFDNFKGSYGAESVETPFLTLIRLAPEDNSPPWAVVVLADNTDAVLNGLAGGKEPELKNLEGGVSSFAGPDGSTWYTASGTGLVAFGPSKSLIAGVAGAADSKVIAPGLAAEVLKGDVGAYVNLSALVKRYGNEIDQARDVLMGALDQAGAQAGNEQTMEAAKKIYGVVFDSLGDADAMALALDFAAERLVVSGKLAVKADTGAAKLIAGLRTGDAGALAALPADSSYYMYMNLDGSSFSELQNMGVAAMAPAGGKLSPELEKALARQKALGAMENTGALSYDQGMRGLTVMKVERPGEMLDATMAVMKEMKGGTGLPPFIKGFEVDPDAIEYRGYTFHHITMTMDFDKLPGGATGPSIAMMKSMFGGDTMNMWYGSDGEKVVQVMANSQDDAQEIFDAFLDGRNTVGSVDSFRSVRDRLPKTATFLGMFSAQGIIRQIATQMATVTNNPNLKPPGDLPKQPVLMGASFGPAGPNTVEFRFVLPSAAGPVFEKGFVPLIQGMQGRVDQ